MKRNGGRECVRGPHSSTHVIHLLKREADPMYALDFAHWVHVKQ